MACIAQRAHCWCLGRAVGASCRPDARRSVAADVLWGGVCGGGEGNPPHSSEPLHLELASLLDTILSRVERHVLAVEHTGFVTYKVAQHCHTQTMCILLVLPICRTLPFFSDLSHDLFFSSSQALMRLAAVPSAGGGYEAQRKAMDVLNRWDGCSEGGGG